MTVKFVNAPNRKLVERALETFVLEVDKSRRKQAAPAQKDEQEPVKSEKGPQNQI